MRRPSLAPALGLVVLLSSHVLLVAFPPASAVAAQLPPEVEMGRLATAASVAGFGNYVGKTRFLPGDQVWLYAEALRAVRNQKVEMVFTFQVIAPDGRPSYDTTAEFKETARSVHWGAWRPYRLPTRLPLGRYTLRVDVLDRQTGGRGSGSVAFEVVSAAGDLPVDDKGAAVWAGHASPAEEPLNVELEEAFAFLRQKQFDPAVRAFRKGLDKSPSARGYLGLAQAYEGMGAFKNMADACDKALRLTQDPPVQAMAHNMKGVALFGRAAEKSSPDKRDMAEAEGEFRAALALDPAIHIARFNMGMLCLRIGDDPPGLEWLNGYLAAEPRGSAAATARSLVWNPRRARENFAPDFSLVTDDGEHFDLEGLKGKVVVLDFWASWCAPCRQTIPYLRGLARKFKDAPFVLISISVDRNVGEWREAIASDKMTWPQYRDGSSTIDRKFSVRSIPTTVLIDGEGIVRERMVGYTSGYGSTLDSGVQKWVKALKNPGAAPQR